LLIIQAKDSKPQLNSKINPLFIIVLR